MDLRILLRQIRKSGFLSLVKFLGLLTGLAIAIVIMVWVKNEFSYDEFWENKHRIYRVALEQYQHGELQFRMASNYRAATDLLMAEFPEVEGRVRLNRDKVTVFTPDAQIQDVQMFYADTCVFDILPRRIVSRESGNLFPDLRSVVISESLSRQIYGNKDPIGQQLKLNEGWTFYVSAVFEDIPDRSHLGFDLLMTMASLRYYMAHFNNLTGELEENPDFEYIEPGPYDNRGWGRNYGYGYILVKEETCMDEFRRKAQLLFTPENLPSRFSDLTLNLLFQPISDIHLHSSLSEEIKQNGSILRVYIMLLVAIIVLIISIINFINLSVIGFYDQSENAAIRMIHGAGIKGILFGNFIKELIIGVAAGVLSVIVAHFALRSLMPGSAPGLHEALLVIVILISCASLSLIVPFLYLKYHGVIDLLKRKAMVGAGGMRARKNFIAFQFAISTFLIAGTIVIFSQLQFIQKRDPGFNPDAVIYSYSPMTMNQRPDIQEKLMVFRDRVSQIPGVINFSTSSSIPGRNFLMSTERVARAGSEPDRQTYFQILNIDQFYLPTYRFNLISGRNFPDTHQYPGSEVILNQSAAQKLGFLNPADAVGEIISVDGSDYPVCGVVQNFHHISLKEEILPVIIFKSLQWRYAVGYYSFRLSPADLSSTIQLIDRAWTDVYPGERFLYKFLDDSYREQYAAEENFGKSVTAGSFLAIFISCLGLLGFVRYSAVKRIKEIGIRKAFGANGFDILILFNTEILKMVGISSLFGLPAAWFLMDKWLMNFAYRIELTAWMFLAALLLTALIAVIATFYISWRASRANPVESLKYE